MYLIVGLGNPGPQYEGTRHNIGFHFVDSLAQEAGISLANLRFQGMFGKGKFEGCDVVLLKPLTYMNLSGTSVREALAFFKIPPDRMIVVFDDLDQDTACVRMRTGGGHGGHNGVRDILAKLGTESFHRLKIGIGKPVHKSATANWVLGRFSDDELAKIKNESFSEGKNRLVMLFKHMNSKTS